MTEVVERRPDPSPRLRALVRRADGPADPPPAADRCGLCSEPVPGGHRHVLDVASHEVLCACQPCSLLFDRDAAGGDHFRLVPDRRRPLDPAPLTDETLAELGVPVGLAFFFERTSDTEIAAVYPSPAGPMQSTADRHTWERLVAAHPDLAGLEADVEALLVNRARGARELWLAPIDDCYRLVGLFRRHWEGLNGGDEIWRHVEAFFSELREAAGVGSRSGGTS